VEIDHLSAINPDLAAPGSKAAVTGSEPVAK
jgi:hypothetical protein